MTQDDHEQDPVLDEHWAASRDSCRKIGDRIGKQVKRIEGPVDESLLPYRCLYDGPQTNFSDHEGDDHE